MPMVEWVKVEVKGNGVEVVITYLSFGLQDVGRWAVGVVPSGH